MAGGGNPAGGRQDPWTSAFRNLATEDGLAVSNARIPTHAMVTTKGAAGRRARTYWLVPVLTESCVTVCGAMPRRGSRMPASPGLLHTTQQHEAERLRRSGQAVIQTQ